MKKTLRFLTTLLLLGACTTVWSQATLRGTVRDGGGLLPGVAVQVKGSSIGMTTDANGEYALKLANGTYEVVYSFLGFNTITRNFTITGSDITADVILESSSTELNAVVITTGSRNTQRTIIDSPLPIDILSAKDLSVTGQQSFDKAMQYRVPSFNTVNTPVNDATTLLDPWELRNMGPSRTLILINGKRKNLSSLLYVQFSPGRGETGVDLSSIPQDAIKRVEILRDGASAQYGSDAIAGVINVILKDKYDYSSLNITSGITGKGDGASYGVSLNSGSNFGRGFVNYTVAFNQQNSAVRSGTIHEPTEIATFGDGKGGAQDQLIKAYLKDYPTGNNINGTGDVSAAKFLINTGIPVSDKGEVYANGAFVIKRVSSFANFRTPYWRQDRGLLHKPTDNGGKNYLTAATLAFPSDGVDLYKGYIGYVPTFEGDMRDYNATIGAKNETNGWKQDLSLTFGGNQQLYTVDNTVNRGLGKLSPTRFRPGGYAFDHRVGNIDISKSITEEFGIAFGAEARSETFTIVAGDTASYKAEGSNSFPGLDIANAGKNSRFNLGGYLDLSYDISKSFLINGTVRSEKYSDFGTATVFKASSRYKFLDDKVVVRGSYSTGFRAPSLHQIYAQSTQAAFVGGTIQLSGLFNNRSSQARALGIDALRPEKSTNVTLGVALNPTKNLSISLDYFSINVKDRIVYSSSISTSDSTSTLFNILQTAGASTIQFFINGIETNTSGLDYVVSYRNIPAGSGKIAVNLAGNFVLNNEIVGAPVEPDAIVKAKASILNAQIRSLLTESRPKYKAILGIDYSVNKFNVNLNGTLFGSTAFRDLDNGGGSMNYIKAVFKPAFVTDLSIGYQFTDKISLGVNLNNILGTLPKWDLEFSPIDPGKDATAEAAAKKLLETPADKALLRGFLGFSGRYDILGYNGSQFSQLGRLFNAQLTVKF
jgi:iron complex outermembrane recepter protein